MESFSDNTTYQLVTVIFGIENVRALAYKLEQKEKLKEMLWMPS